MPQRLGVFGGTFDPPHRGHLAVAKAAQRTFALDRVLLVVANDPWKKSPDRAITPPADRLAMVQALASNQAGLEVSDREIRRGGPSYTVVTLRELAAAHPDSELFLIIGRDLVDDFSSWHESVEIGRLATIVVVDRPGYVTDPQRDWKMLIIEPVDVSSTELREQLQQTLPADSKALSHMTPEVLQVIRSRGLYGTSAEKVVPTS